MREETVNMQMFMNRQQLEILSLESRKEGWVEIQKYRSSLPISFPSSLLSLFSSFLFRRI
jgi:hypothetical protein